MSVVAVLDVGKTRVKLSAVSAGTVLETLSTPNVVHPGPPWRHHDLSGMETWVAQALHDLGKRHPVSAIVPCGHGSGAVLVSDESPALPMIDYEDRPPPRVDAAYHTLAGSFRERGSPVMLGASHIARQLLWMDMEQPTAVAGARWFLGLPQYWAWRLSGIAASEPTILGAQSHLWAVRDRRWGSIVAARGWERLLPPLRRADDRLGPLLPEWVARTGLPASTPVLCGIHDSSANFHRYRAAGLSGLTVVSTGTWIVALSDAADPDTLDEMRGMTCNAYLDGSPLPGALCMGGREFALVAGTDTPRTRPDPEILRGLLARGTLPVPCFGDEDGLLPGRARRGFVHGPPPESEPERLALALVHAALLTDLCLDVLGRTGDVVLDGTFAVDPHYPALVAALRPGTTVLASSEAYGTAIGASLLAGEFGAARAPLALHPAAALDMPRLHEARVMWRRLAGLGPNTLPET